MRGVAAGVACVLLLLAALHMYWVVRGVGTGAGVPSRVDGTPAMRPGRMASLAVTLALTLAATLVLSRADVLQVAWPKQVPRIGTWGVATAFAARTVGEFHYVGLFKRVRDTPFGRWDTRLYTPLCAALAIGCAVVAAS